MPVVAPMRLWSAAKVSTASILGKPLQHRKNGPRLSQIEPIIPFSGSDRSHAMGRRIAPSIPPALIFGYNTAWLQRK
jgi:hypothetical protein